MQQLKFLNFKKNVINIYWKQDRRRNMTLFDTKGRSIPISLYIIYTYCIIIPEQFYNALKRSTKRINLPESREKPRENKQN